MPASNIGWRRNTFWELIRRIQLFILNKLAESLGAPLIIIELKESQLGRPDSGTDKFINVALVFGVKKQLTVFADVLLELFLKLDHVFEYQLFLWSVLLVVQRRTAVLELPAPLQLLVYHVLTLLIKFVQLLLFSLRLYL